MRNPGLADKIFTVLKYDGWKTALDVAFEVNEDHPEVDVTIREMVTLKKDWFKTRLGYGENIFKLIKRRGFENEMHLWTLTGGFVNHQKGIDNEILRERADKELQKLQMENVLLKKQLKYYFKLKRHNLIIILISIAEFIALLAVIIFGVLA